MVDGWCVYCKHSSVSEMNVAKFASQTISEHVSSIGHIFIYWLQCSITCFWEGKTMITCLKALCCICDIFVVSWAILYLYFVEIHWWKWNVLLFYIVQNKFLRIVYLILSLSISSLYNPIKSVSICRWSFNALVVKI